MLKDVAVIAAACIKQPTRRAVWSPQLARYVCPDLVEGEAVSLDYGSPTHPPISAEHSEEPHPQPVAIPNGGIINTINTALGEPG